MFVDRVKVQATGSYTFTSAYVDDDGVTHPVTASASVVIKDGAGASVFTGTPTIVNGSLSVAVAVGLMAKLDTYAFTWTGSVDGVSHTWDAVVELVGGYLFEIADLRAEDRAFADTTKYPTSLLKEVRNWVEDVIEGDRAANVAFVPRGRRITLDGSARYSRRAYGLDVPTYEVKTVYAASVDSVALSEAQVSALICDDNTIWRTDGTWNEGHKNVTLHFKHGHDFPPGGITRAALMLAREYVVKSDLPNRATATSIGDQMFRLTIAGRDGITGLPDVDAAIEQFGRKTYMVG